MKNNTDKNLIPRPPIVVVMGHIDHGKTTLLDYIRISCAKAAPLGGEPRPVAGRESGPPRLARFHSVAESEAGGITQHVGAYEIEYNNKKITFIDTPGHEAFSKMRARGARVADLAILVVAADDGVKAQTLEAINAIKEAKIPFIVAINKTDKEAANPERVKNELAKNEIYLEGAGGNVPAADISAKTGQGVSELLELVILVSEMEELKADPGCPASGVVVESHLDPKRGISAVLIIQNGTLEKKMFVNAGGAIAPVKIFENFLGKPVDKAIFSSPINIIGFDKLPEAGANFRAYDSRKEAESARTGLADNCPVAGVFKEENGKKIIIPIIIKADVSGSIEALQKEILKLTTEEVAVEIIRANIGNITEDDIKLASSAGDSIIVGFRVKADANITEIAERLGVRLAFFDIIYKLSEWLEEEIKKRTPVSSEEEKLGTGELLKIFLKEKNKQIIGGKVIHGKIVAGKYVKVSRRGIQIAKGKILELQHNRIQATEIEEGNEFGAMLDIKNELAKGDLIEIYDVKTLGQN